MAVHGTESRFQDMTLKVDSLVLDEVAVTATAAELNALAASGVSAAEMAVLNGATAGTAVAGKAMVTDSVNAIAAYRDFRTTVTFRQANAASALDATAGVPSSYILSNGIISSTTAAAVVGTLPTGTAFDTALLVQYPTRAVGDSLEFVVVNTGPNSFTLATAAGVTDGGNAFTAVATGTSATFRIRITAANAYTIYRVA